MSLGTASSFAVLAGPAVTCTDSTINGDVGIVSPVPPGSSVTQINCTFNGTEHLGDPVAQQAYADFLIAYDALALKQCDEFLSGTLAGVTLKPGVYCFDAAATLTGTLTLAGPSKGIWIFKIGTGGTGALTGTNFSVVMANGALACNVYWRVAETATMTTSDFKGTILAGAAITLTGGSFAGRALTSAAVTLTGVAATGCRGGTFNPPLQRCNQGVGNGPELCDPGNSNQGRNPFVGSNDDLGGVPRNPGRKGGNK
ncbi:MAG: ice-binding family protein [Pseudomonadota bacterium]